MNKLLLLLIFSVLLISSCDSQGVSVISGGLDPNSTYNINAGAISNVTTTATDGKIGLDTNIVGDFGFNVAVGTLHNYDSQFKFCRNNNVGSSDEVLWDFGGDYHFLVGNETMSVVSSSSLDTFGGSGAWNIILYGLDGNGNEISEVLNLSGLTPVVTTQKFHRLYRAFIINDGSGEPVVGANQGTITITSSNTSTVQAGILPNVGQTLMCVYTVPNCKTAYVTGLSASVGQGKEAQIFGKFRNSKDGAFSVKFDLMLFENSFYGELVVPLAVPSGTDIVLTAKDGSTGTSVGASFGMILKDNEGCV